MNASPDLPAQIQSFPALHPAPEPARNTPLAGILLTNADLDHLLGLFALREGPALDIYSTAAVRATAENELGLETVLNAFCGSRWHEPARADFAALEPRCPLQYRAIELSGQPPRFTRDRSAGNAAGQSVAYQFRDAQTGGRLLVAPDVAAVNERLLEALRASQVVLFDGTFWSAEELGAVRPGAPAAHEMGHLPIRDGSLELLAGLPARAKVYIHINNTNPILAPNSPERAAVEAAGVTVGADGMEFEL